jgi:hypothetical protein
MDNPLVKIINAKYSIPIININLLQIVTKYMLLDIYNMCILKYD